MWVGAEHTATDSYTGQAQALEVAVFSGFQIVLPFGSVFSGFPSTVAIPWLACFPSAGICFSC